MALALVHSNNPKVFYLYRQAEAQAVFGSNSQNIGLKAGPALVSAALPPAPTNNIVSGALLAANSPSPATGGEDFPINDQISVYVVHEGDTLSAIAKMFGVSVNTIVWANDLNAKASLQTGQALVILPVSGVQHTVKSGETIKSIAAKYHADAADISRFNGLDNPDLVAGQELIIPNGEEVPTTPSKPVPAKPGEGVPSYAGYYQRPITGGVKTQGIHGRNAVDLAAPAGTPIYAAAPGTVIISKMSGYNGGYANYIVIAHPNGTQTLYAHNTDNVVSVGQTVIQGQLIGHVGMTGNATGPHVHFEIRGAKNPF
jgi:murein DD-endopeptidase MepM/ murein hydrolase activator NlpD